MKFSEFFAKKQQIYHKKPKFLRILQFKIKHYLNLYRYLKGLLVWLEVMPEEEDINRIIRQWNKNIAKWLFEILGTGILVYLAIGWIFQLKLGWITIGVVFSLGISWFVIGEIYSNIIDGLCRFAKSFPKK